MQPRALTIKKNKIKCILLEFPLGLKGKRVNFPNYFPYGIFMPFFTTVGARLRLVEKIPVKSCLPGAPTASHPELGRRPGEDAGRPAHLSSPSLCLATLGEKLRSLERGQFLN